MSNFNDYFRSKDFLTAADLQGRDVSLRIGRVTPETVNGDAGKETALIVYFDGAQKKLRLNRTNASAIAHLSGTQDYDQWAGKTIVLYPTTVDFRGAIRDAIRVRTAAAANAVPPPAAANATADDKPPF